MIDVSKILHDKKAAAFFSFIIGMGLMILLFHRPFGSQQSLSMPVSEIEGKPIRIQGRCYSYTSEDAKCPSSK
jgi:hypothetical protein